MLLKEKRKNKEKSANLQTMKQANLSLIFGLIRQCGSVSRAELANLTGLSPTTVSSLVDELLVREFVHQTGTGVSETSGRKPIMLEINPSGGCFAGVELTDSGVHCEIFDLAGESKSFISVHVSDFSDIGGIVIRLVEAEVKKIAATKDKLFGVCMGVPGILDPINHQLLTSTILPQDCDKCFFDVIKNYFFPASVFVGNESHFCAYYEKSRMGTRVRSLLYIDFNMGIGAGIILDDVIWTGAFGNAGEIGHISIDLNGPICKCGKKGCLETLASIPVIEKRAGVLLGKKIGFAEIVQLYIGGDGGIRALIDETATYLAYGIDNVVNIINPEAIIIGGEIAHLGELFLQLVRTRLLEISFEPSARHIAIKYSDTKENIVTHGCAQYLLDMVFHQEDFFEE